MSTPNIIRVAFELNGEGLTPTGSALTVNTFADQASEKREEKSIVVPTNTEDDYPDGGFAAWSVIFGSSCVVFATLGLLNSWGVFQSYYQRVLIPETSTPTIAWIGSIQFALNYLPGLITGRLSDRGYFKHVLFTFSAILVVATILTAECKEYWQLLLCQGILTGVACGMIFGPIPAVSSQWFLKRRALAFGVISFGASIGGTIIPIAARRLIDLVGFKWTMRIIALIEFFVLAIANLTIRQRIEPRKETGPFFALHDFKKPAFVVYTIAGITSFLGLYTLLTYIDLSATTVGIPADFSFYLVAITNAGSGLGRISAGILAHRFGELNLITPLTLLGAVMTFIWPFITTRGAFVTVGIINGLCSGAYVALMSLPVIKMGDIHDSGRRVGTFWTLVALGALAGPPIAGAIVQKTGSFKDAGYYAGSCICGAVALLYLTKYLMIGSLRGKC